MTTPTTTSDQPVIITRTFDAPPSLVFKAFSDPAILKHWWGPKGFTTPAFNNDFRVGGKLHYCMRSADGSLEIWGQGTYQEIVEPSRIAYTDTFADPQGNVVPPSHYGIPDGYPAETLITLTFVEHEGKTKFTMHQTVGTTMSAEDREGSMGGWNEMFDRLAEELSHA